MVNFFINSYTKSDAVDFFKQGHTCKETDIAFRFPKGTTHDLMVEHWKEDKERDAKRRREERMNEKC